MDEKLLTKQFEELKHQLPVNEDLRRELRRSFGTKNIRRRRPGWRPAAFAAAAVAAVACLVLLVYMIMPDNLHEKVNAAALKISNQISFVEIGSVDLGVAEHNGTIYFPIAGKGLFAYDRQGFHKIYEQAGFVRVSPDGRQLVLAAGGNLKIYDLANGKVQELLKGDDRCTFYEEPSWSPDSKRFVFVKKIIEPRQTHGFTVKESGIYEIDLQSRQISSKLADGSYPSYVHGTAALVLEKDNQIIYKDLKDGSEQVIDTGRFPSVSPDGNYVAYVKLEQASREIAANATVVESVSNVWIADVNLASKKRVTTNYLYRYIDEKEWLEGLGEVGNVPQALEFSGIYDYYDPVWSSDAQSLYVVKNRNLEGAARLMRIDFSTGKLTAADTVKRYAQALVLRDDDFANRLMKNPPPIFTISNPHFVGYRIGAAGKENGQDYVEAEIQLAYTAQPDYYIKKCRYYLAPSDNGYAIERIENLSSTDVFSRDGQAVVLRRGRGEKETVLFQAGDLPAKYLPAGKYRLASLAYHEETTTLIFTIQVLQDQALGQKASVKILSYNVSTGQFQLLDEIDTVAGKSNIGVSNLIMDAQGEYVAVDLYSDDDPAYKSYLVVYNTRDSKKVHLNALFRDTALETVHSGFWDESELVLNLTSSGQILGYIYNPAKEELTGF
jgi:hypothetical protein